MINLTDAVGSDAISLHDESTVSVYVVNDNGKY